MPRDGIAANFKCQSGPCFANRPSMQELLDPEFNIKWGVSFLAELIRLYGGDIREALKAYGLMDVGYDYADKVLEIYNQFKRFNCNSIEEIIDNSSDPVGDTRSNEGSKKEDFCRLTSPYNNITYLKGEKTPSGQKCLGDNIWLNPISGETYEGGPPP